MNHTQTLITLEEEEEEEAEEEVASGVVIAAEEATKVATLATEAATLIVMGRVMEAATTMLAMIISNRMVNEYCRLFNYYDSDSSVSLINQLKNGFICPRLPRTSASVMSTTY